MTVIAPMRVALNQASFGPQALEYLQGHAINPHVAAGVDVREEDGALIYPYGDFERRRPLQGRETFQPKGVALRAWWPCGREAADTVFVCEGESDALAALSHSITMPVVAIPGTSYASKLGVELVGLCREAILALDGDKAGDQATMKAAQALGRQGILTRRASVPRGLDLADALVRGHDLQWIISSAQVMRVQMAPKRPDKPRIKHDGHLDTIPPHSYFEALTGVPTEGKMFVHCPLPDHEDSTPSCQVFDDPKRGWYCWGCQRGGTIYDLAAALWGLKTRGADFKEVKRRLEEALS